MQGAPPLASPGAEPSAAREKRGEPYARQGGACLSCRRPALPLWYPAGGLPALSPAYPAFSFVLAPIPPTPFPSGEGGGSKIILPGATAPRHPCPEPPAARTAPVVLVPGGIPCREPLPVGFAANYGFSSGDARGEAPCIRKLKVSPFPLGRGLGGWGQQRQLTAGAAGDQEGKPPLRTPQRHGQPATSRASPPHRIQQRQVEPATKKHPLTPKETRFTLDRLPAFMYNYNEKGGSMARIPPPDTRFEQFVKIRICIDNHVTVCYNSDTAEEPRRNAP